MTLCDFCGKLYAEKYTISCRRNSSNEDVNLHRCYDLCGSCVCAITWKAQEFFDNLEKDSQKQKLLEQSNQEHHQ